MGERALLGAPDELERRGDQAAGEQRGARAQEHRRMTSAPTPATNVS